MKQLKTHRAERKLEVKLSIRAMVAGLMLMTLPSCQCQDNKTSLANDDKAVSDGTKELQGIYEFVYEHNTPDLNENHYIHLETAEGTLGGTYFGTSDDFDSAREGYLPGFFKTNLRDAIFQDGVLRFKIIVKEEDFFSEPFSPYNTAMPQKRWPQASGVGGERSFQGKRHDDDLIIESSNLPTRTFSRK